VPWDGDSTGVIHHTVTHGRGMPGSGGFAGMRGIGSYFDFGTLCSTGCFARIELSSTKVQNANKRFVSAQWDLPSA